MIIEIERLIADWLGHEDVSKTDGVNDYLPGIPRDAGDSQPTVLAAVYDETRDDCVASRNDPPNTPCLYLVQDSPMTLAGEVETQVRDSDDAVLAIRYLTTSYDTAQGIQDTSYTLRAVVKSLRALTQASSAERTRNSVCLLAIHDIVFVPITEAVGDSHVTGALVVTLEVRDAAP